MITNFFVHLKNNLESYCFQQFSVNLSKELRFPFKVCFGLGFMKVDNDTDLTVWKPWVGLYIGLKLIFREHNLQQKLDPNPEITALRDYQGQ